MGANIIDLKTVDIANISAEEVFAVDTNVLVWTHYSKASDPCLKVPPYQVVEYPNFMAKLLNNKNKIITTNLNITELMGVIERNEYNIYKQVNNCKGLKFKDFRALVAERNNYKTEIDTIMMQIKAAFNNQIEIIEITDEKISLFQQNINGNRCDVFDYIILDYLKGMGIKNVVSDDKDFASIDDINLYTTYDT